MRRFLSFHQSFSINQSTTSLSIEHHYAIIRKLQRHSRFFFFKIVRFRFSCFEIFPISTNIQETCNANELNKTLVIVTIYNRKSKSVHSQIKIFFSFSNLWIRNTGATFAPHPNYGYVNAHARQSGKLDATARRGT